MEPVDLPPDMIAKYVERRRADLETLEHSLVTGNLEKIKAIAHQIKGNALSFGFQDLNRIVIQMEDAALSNNQSILIATIENFRSWVTTTRQAM